jgi:hypothetical protein
MTSNDKSGPAPWRLLLASIVLFLSAFGARIFFLSNVAPIAAAEDAQSLWALETAFLLKAVENIAAFGAVLVVVAWVARTIGRRRSVLGGVDKPHLHSP